MLARADLRSRVALSISSASRPGTVCVPLWWDSVIVRASLQTDFRRILLPVGHCGGSLQRSAFYWKHHDLNGTSALLQALRWPHAARVDRRRRITSGREHRGLARVRGPVSQFIPETRVAFSPPANTARTRGDRRKTAPHLRLGKFRHCEASPRRNRSPPDHG